MAVHTSRARRDKGVALVEFALILPLFMMLMLGMFTGGIAYNRKLAMTNASREAARFGATLSVAGAGGMTAWLDRVAEVAVGSAEGEMDVGVPGRSVCVAYVHPSGTPAVSRRMQTGSGAAVYSAQSCYTDGQTASVPRVQVVLGRTSTMQAMVFSRELNLVSRTVVRFEATEL